ncbi:MAG: hypothetical protein EA397_14560 [Deltaproteobacteria bacterium]|nr:MAG: hypothetical protein EA397_14560 [Deltaproteobacteria bacterium]
MPCHVFRSELATMGLARLDGASMPFAEPGVEPHYAPSRKVKIEHIDLSLDLDLEGRRFTGEATVHYRAMPSFKGTFFLDLDDVEVDGVTRSDGEPVDYTHEGEVLRISGAAPEGAVVVRWHGERPTRGLYFTGPELWASDRRPMAWTQLQDEDAHFVFPCHDHPSQKHAWTIRLRGPAGYTLISNGLEVEQGEDERGAFAVFEQNDPMPAYLLVMIAAELVCEETLWKDRPVRYLVPEGQDESVLLAFGKTPLMLEHFSHITGVAYPWPRYDQVVVHDFIFGGMENVACTVMTDLLLVDELAAVEWDPDRLVAHELAHQWFGDLLTCQDWSQAWLNESWATFMEVVWWEADRSEADAAWYRYGQAKGYLSEDSGRYRRPIVSYTFREPIDVFDRHIYEKGACVLNTLRTELGPEAFWRGARLYLERHRHRTVHSRHFQRAMEDATGRNLDRFFHQWIEGAGHPALKVGLRTEEDLLIVSVEQTQSGEQTAEAFHFTLPIQIVMADGSTSDVRLPVRDRKRAFAMPMAGEVALIRVDPGFNLLSTIELSASRSWLTQLLRDACPVLSVRAARALIKQGSPASLRAVIGALADHELWQVRGALAEELAKLGGPEVREALLARLSDEEDLRVRRILVTALGSFHDAEVATALLEEVSREELGTWHLRGAALESLGKTRDPRAVEALRAQIDGGGWAGLVSAGALKGLAATRDPTALDDLLARTRAAYPPHVRMGAAVALGRLGDEVESVRSACRERLIEMLTEPGFRPQLAAVNALAVLGDQRAIPALSRLKAMAADGRTKRMAYEALYTLRKGRTSEEALQSLRSQVEKLTEENAKLRSRLDKLERIEGE